MLISADLSIPFPRALVYETYRDKLVELLPYMPNVRRLTVQSRRDEGAKVHCVIEWHGGGEIPMAARAILSENMLSWTEHDLWNEAEFLLEWRIETHAFTEAVDCTGKNRFIADGNTTIIESRGELKIDSTRIKGVPHFLATGVAHLLEDFLGTKIEPNLIQMGAGVRHYLETAAKSAKI
jgi:hypothetical protein